LLPPDEPTCKVLKLYQNISPRPELVLTLRAPEAEQAERLAVRWRTRLREQTNLVASVSWQPPWNGRSGPDGELLGWLWYINRRRTLER